MSATLKSETRKTTLAAFFVALMLLAPLGALVAPAAIAGVTPTHDETLLGDDHGLADASEPDGFWNTITGFSTKAGYRQVFAWDTDEPIAGIVHWGFSEDAMDNIVRPLANVVDSAQMAIMDIDRSEVDASKTIYFQVHDQISGALSPVTSFTMGSAWESDFSDGVYEINALMQIDTQSLPDGIPTQQGLQAFADASKVFAERVWDASDGYVRIANMIVTDTTLNYPANIPFGVPLGGTLGPINFAGGVCPDSMEVEGHIIQNTLADFLVETVPPADSHTYGDISGEPAIGHPCTAFYIGREGWLRIPTFLWEGDTDIASTMHHEFGHYAYAMDDLYDINGGGGCRAGVSGDPNNAAGRYDISVMHNTHKFNGARWEASEYDREATPCDRLGGDVSWNKLTQYYTGIPALGRNGDGLPVHSDSDPKLARGNPNGDALNIFILDHAVGASSLKHIVRNDPVEPGTPEVTISAPTDNDEVGPTTIPVVGLVDRNGGDGNAAPLATLTSDVTSGGAPLDVTFSLGATDSDGTIATWSIDFGDGSPASSGTGGPPSSVMHSYTFDGQFDAILSVMDDQGAAGQALRAISVGLGGGIHEIGTDPTGDVETGSCAGVPDTCERSWVAGANDGFDLTAAYIADLGDGVRFSWQLKDLNTFLTVNPSGAPATGPNSIAAYQLSIPFRTTPGTGYVMNVAREFDTNTLEATLGKRVGALGISFSLNEPNGAIETDLVNNLVHVTLPKDALPELAAVNEFTEMDATSYFVQTGAGSRLLQPMDAGLQSINDDGAWTLSGMVELAGFGVHETSTPKSPPSSAPADPHIADASGDAMPGGIPADQMDLRAGWFDNDDDFMYIGLEVEDIPADATTTAQVAYHVSFLPQYPVSYNTGTNTFTHLRVEAVLSAAAFSLGPLPPGVTPTDGVTKFTLQAMSTDGTRSFFSHVAELPLSSVDADTDIFWFVIPRSLLQDPQPLDGIGVLGADTGLAVQGALTVNIGDQAGALDNYQWKGATLPLDANAGGLYVGVAGQAIPIAGTATGGTEPYTCAWTGPAEATFGDDTACMTTVTFASVGDYFIDLTVTDANNDDSTDTAGVDVNAPTGERVEIVLDGASVIATAFTSTSTSSPQDSFNLQADLTGLSGTHSLTANWYDDDESLLASDSVNVLVTGTGAAFVNILNPDDSDQVAGSITISGNAGHGTPQGQGAAAFGPGGIFEMMPAVERSGEILSFCACDAPGHYSNSVAWLTGAPGSVYDGTDGRWLDVTGFAGAQYTLDAEITAMDIVWFNSALDLDDVGINSGPEMPKTGNVPAGANWAFVYMRIPSVANVDQVDDTAVLTLTTSLGAPTNVAGAPSFTSVDLTWNAPSSDGGSAISSYNVYREGGLIGATPDGTTLSYSDSGLTMGTSYTYEVAAVNGDGEGPKSAPVMVTTTADLTPPSAVTGLAATTTSSSASLSWTAATDAESGVSHYRIERDGAQIADNVVATSYTEGGLASLTTYNYEVFAVNGVGLEGAGATTQATTTGGSGPEEVTVSFGGSVVGTVLVTGGSWSINFDTTTVSDGTYQIQADYDDGQGGSDTDTINVEVLNSVLQPFVNILTPSAGTTIEPPFTFSGSFSTDGDEPAPQAEPIMNDWLTSYAEDPFVQEVQASVAFKTLRAQLDSLDGFLTLYALQGGQGVHAAFSGAVPSGLPATIGDGWTLYATGDLAPETAMLQTDVRPTQSYTPAEIAAGALDSIERPSFMTSDPTIQNGIGPGTAMLIYFGADGFICTASFLTYDPIGDDYYLGTAGHCILNGGSGSVGPGPHALKPDSIELCVDLCLWNWVGLGIYAEVPDADDAIIYARADGVGKDFGLIKIPKDLESQLRPEMFRWGGPMGTARGEGGDFLAHFGHSYTMGSNIVTQGRYAQTNADQSYTGGIDAIGVLWGGDSGSAVGTAHLGGTLGEDFPAHGDAAAGSLTHSLWIPNPVVDNSLPFIFGTDWQWGLDQAKAVSGIEVLLVNEDGTLDGEIGPIGPTADFTFAENGLDVVFADASVAGDEAITSWSWDFGGEGVSTDANPSFTFSAPGTYSVTLTVTDGGSLSDSMTKPVTVDSIDAAFEVAARILGPSGEVLGWTTVATADDGEEGYWSLNWNPASAELGSYTIEARLTQDGNEVASDDLAFLVGILNGAPVLSPIGDKVALEGANLNFGVSASDPDGDSLTLSATNLPVGASFTDHGDGTGTFDWTPAFGDMGDYAVTFTADDGLFTDSETISVLVTDVDRPPVLTALPDQWVPLTATQSWYVYAADPDGQAVTFGIAGLPAGGAIVPNGQGGARIDFPGQATPGDVFAVTVSATAGGLTASDDFLVTIVDWQEIEVTAAGATFLNGAPGDVLGIDSRVQNVGTSPVTVSFETSSNHGWAVTTPAPIVLAAGESQLVHFSVSVGSNAQSTIKVAARVVGGGGAGDDLYYVVKTPVVAGLQLESSSVSEGLSGIVTARFLNGAPATSVRVTVEDVLVLDPYGLSAQIDTGLTGADGRFGFALGKGGLPVMAPGEHKVTVTALRGSTTTTLETTYTAGIA